MAVAGDDEAASRPTSRFNTSEACWTTLRAARSDSSVAASASSRASIAHGLRRGGLGPLVDALSDAADGRVEHQRSGTRRPVAGVDVERHVLQVLDQSRLELDQRAAVGPHRLGILECGLVGLARGSQIAIEMIDQPRVEGELALKIRRRRCPTRAPSTCRARRSPPAAREECSRRRSGPRSGDRRTRAPDRGYRDVRWRRGRARSAPRCSGDPPRLALWRGAAASLPGLPSVQCRS